MAEVQLHNVAKRFGEFRAVDNVNLNIAHNEFLVLVGPSGCGKSTILRMIAGLEEVSDGEIHIGGRMVNELAPKDRDIAMVFQDYALYPHLTVYQNMSFGLEMQRRPGKEIRQRVVEAARILNLETLLERKPKQLSGGQRQRVAMGRAIVRHPQVFLFDEPLSNLDAKLRVQMRTEIKKLHRQVATTVIYVTHDQVEAMTLADRIVVMRDGLVEQIGTPDEVYNAPATTFVASFIGAPTMNLLPATIAPLGEGLAAQLAEDVVIALPDAHAKRYRHQLGKPVTFGIRPEHFGPSARGLAPVTGRIDLIEPLGSDTLLYLQVGAHDLVARLPPRIAATAGETITLGIDMSQMRLFDAETGRDIT